MNDKKLEILKGYVNNLKETYKDEKGIQEVSKFIDELDTLENKKDKNDNKEEFNLQDYANKNRIL
ncbi:MAG: hypothetical protein WAO56_01240 [Miniphocaeibacter sp.]|uniref:hypothetical protein n=1 Tax=Miniphocaeibacter sp. TaxID=3100973 RepID=UPI0017D14637|nr:hypothetical protein [Gallicola sp.]